MPKPGTWVGRGLIAAVLLPAIPVSAQNLRIGAEGAPGGPVAVAGLNTLVDIGGPANTGGLATAAKFGWTTASCPAAAKIKFFRPSPADGARYDLIAERGPFDIPPLAGDPLPYPYPLMTVYVELTPPVLLQRGDVIGITTLTSCGRPTSVSVTPGAVVLDGDVGDFFFNFGHSSLTSSVFVTATGVSTGTGGRPVLLLLRDRFAVSLEATDPRTGAQATGVPSRTSDRSGSFSLPAFTGNEDAPEVVVKMIDATGSPELGGRYWFFFAPLTDVDITITVTDLSDGVVRTYTASASGGGLSCGFADTNAFAKREGRDP